MPESPRTQILRAERSSKMFASRCGGHLARETSTMLSHQMAPRITIVPRLYREFRSSDEDYSPGTSNFIVLMFWFAPLFP